MALPQVGVQVVALGAKTASYNLNLVMRDIVNLKRVTNALEQTGAANFAGLGGAATGAAIAATAATATMIAGMSAVIAKSTEMAASFENTMTIVGAMSGATKSQVVEASNVAMEMARNTTVSLSSITEIMNQLVQAGVSIEDTMNGAAQAVTNMIVAAGGSIDLQRAVLAVAGAVNTFGLAGKDAARAADAMSVAALKSAISFADVQRSFQQASTGARLLHYTVEDTATAIGMLGLMGLRGSDAGTSLKQMFISLEKPTKQSIAMMKEYGISLYDENLKAVSLREVIHRLQNSMSDQAVGLGRLTEAKRNDVLATIFGSDAMRAATVFALEGVEAYDKFTDAMEHLKTAQLAAAMYAPTTAQFGILKNQIDVLVTAFGTDLNTAAGKAARTINYFVRGLDVESVKAFGTALVQAMSGQGDLIVMSDKIAKSPFKGVFEAWVGLCKSIYTAIMQRALPAFINLFQALTGGRPLVDVIADGMRTLTRLIDGASKILSYFTNGLAGAIRMIKSTSAGAQIFSNVLQGLLLLPVLGFVDILYSLSKPFIAMGGRAFAASVALVSIPQAFSAIDKITKSTASDTDKAMAIITNGYVLASIASLAYATGLTKYLVPAIVSVGKYALVMAGYMITSIRSLGLIGGISSIFQALWHDLIIFIGRIPLLGRAFLGVSRLIITLAIGVGKAIASMAITVAQGALSAGRAMISGLSAGVMALSNLIYAAIRTGGIVDIAFTTMYRGVVIALNGIVRAMSWFAVAVAKAPEYIAKGLSTIVSVAWSAMTSFAVAVAKAPEALYMFMKTIPGYIQAIRAWAVSTVLAAKNGVVAFAQYAASIPRYLTSVIVAFVANAKAAVINAATVAKAWVLNLPQAVASAAKTIVQATITMALGFYNTAKAAVISAGQSAKAFITITIPAFIAGAKRAVYTLAIITLALIKLGAQAVATAIATRLAFLGTIVSAIGTAATFVVSTILPVILLLAAIGGAVYLLAKAWSDNFMNIREVTKTVIQWVADRVVQFFDFLKGLPIIGDAIKEVAKGIASVTSWVGTNLPKGIETAKSAWNSLYDTAKPVIEGIAAEAKKQLPGVLDMLGLSMPDTSNWDQQWKDNEEAAKKYQEVIDSLGDVGYPELAAGAGSAADETKKWQLLVGQLLKQLPMMTADANEFIAGLAQAEPSRLAGLVIVLISARKQLDAMVEAKKALLQTNLAIVQSENAIAMLEAQINVQKTKYDASIVAYDQQILGLQMQIAQIEAQQLPYKTRAAEIDHQITLLQRENYQAQKELLQLNLAMLPYKQQIADLDKQIAETQRVNYALSLARANIELKQMPYQQQLAAIQEKIARIGDRRLALAQKEKQLVAESALSGMQKDLNDTTKALDEAWNSMDVSEIIRLEALKAQQEQAVTNKQHEVDDLQAEQEEIERRNELAKIGLEYEQIALEEILQGYADKLTAIQNEEDLQNKKNEIVRLGLEAEKQALEDILKPMQDRVDKINNMIDLQKAQNELAILELQHEKDAIDDILYSMDLQKTALENIIAGIELKKQAAELEYRQSVFVYEQQLAQEQAHRAELELTRLQQEKNLTELILGFANILSASGAYTVAEALEVSKRLGLWSDQISAMSNVITEFDNLTNAAKLFQQALDAIPRQIDISIVTHYSSTGSPNTGAGATPPPSAGGGGNQLPVGGGGPGSAIPPGYQHGGIVPGYWGQAMWVLAHGGERFLGINNVSPASTYAAGARRVAPVQNNTYNTNYNVNASYSRVQSAASVAMDLRAMVGMTRR